MKKTKKDKLKKAGWKVGTASDFLELSPEEEAFIEIKLALASYLKQRRMRKKLTQVELARFLRSSQSRVAKMEAGDPTVSFDLIFKTLLLLGANPKQLAKVIGSLQLTAV